MMQEWLRTGGASWEGLCIALAKEFVGHINLAKQIAEKHRVQAVEKLKNPTQASEDLSGKMILNSGIPSLPMRVNTDYRPPETVTKSGGYSKADLESQASSISAQYLATCRTETGDQY